MKSICRQNYGLTIVPKIVSNRWRFRPRCDKNKSETNGQPDNNPTTEQKMSMDGKKVGWSFFPEDENPVEEAEEAEEEEQGVSFIDLTNPSVPEGESLPDLTRSQILTTCCTVCGVFVAMSFFLRSSAAHSPEVLGTDPKMVEALLSIAPGLTVGHVVIGLAAAGVVSGVRVLLYQQWNEFKVATDRSNRQVLTPLGFPDLFVVSCFPGISEELLFRGGFIPALYPDWRGVLVSGMVFGALHKGGGRNIAFAIWASFVGCLFGFVFVLTQDIYVPIIAHSSANLFSAIYWRSLQSSK